MKVRFAIHPVAGRLPGHMNVLLAEAASRTTSSRRWTRSTTTSPTTDVVHRHRRERHREPGALDDPASPIYGMPVLEVWKAARVVMLKRGMAAGLRGRRQPALSTSDNTLMLFGDAKQSVKKLLAALNAG